MQVEREMYEVGALLENFLCKIVFRPQFVLLLFLRSLMLSILPFNYKTKFRCKETFSGKMEWVFTVLFKTFCGKTLWGKEILVEKLSCGY